ncbi:hypothetical protein FQA47_024569 [Oryzias melastigma]|uniref:Uncharacterized protein n=1 Tax=Oryzias melastigma TaxID=30732 RepID=A0A834FL21_ORYME|nr:hypothetical protein FQA47_024569 [Oryzias melastigma]
MFGRKPAEIFDAPLFCLSLLSEENQTVRTGPELLLQQNFLKTTRPGDVRSRGVGGPPDAPPVPDTCLCFCPAAQVCSQAEEGLNMTRGVKTSAEDPSGRHRARACTRALPDS